MSVSDLAARPSVTVVVPIYNVERYLRECVESILAQTLENIEVILVDDGSTDASGSIADEYAEKDPRVTALHHQNSGYTFSVNRGIDAAHGEYIGIIESDDWIDHDMYERLYNDAVKYDTDLTKGCFYKSNSLEPNPWRRDIVFRNAAGIDLYQAPNGAFELSDWPLLLSFHPSIWSAIYRADFLKAIKIPDSPGASYQDFPFIIEVLCKAKRISVVKRCMVHWRNEADQGNSTSANGEKLLRMPKNTKAALDIIVREGRLDELKENFYIHATWANLAFYQRIDESYKPEYYLMLRDIYMPLKGDESFEYKFFTPEERCFVESFITDELPDFVKASGLCDSQDQASESEDPSAAPAQTESSESHGSSPRELIGKVAGKVFPSYRAARYAIAQIEGVRGDAERLNAWDADLDARLNGLVARTDRLEARAAELERRALEAERRCDELAAENKKLRTRLDLLRSRMHRNEGLL